LGEQKSGGEWEERRLGRKGKLLKSSLGSVKEVGGEKEEECTDLNASEKGVTSERQRNFLFFII